MLCTVCGFVYYRASNSAKRTACPACQYGTPDFFAGKDHDEPQEPVHRAVHLKAEDLESLLHPNRSIEVVNLIWPSDPSVGIGERVVVITDSDGLVFDARCLDLADVDAAEREFREKLADAFEVVGDGRPSVICHYD